MKNTQTIFAIIIIVILMGMPITVHDAEAIKVSSTSTEVISKTIEKLVEVKMKPIELVLYPHQEGWINKLQFCESGTDATQINEVDVDGTSSFYAFQFKPSTFKNYGEKYNLIDKKLSRAKIMQLIKDTKLQRAIVRRMINDPQVRLLNEFPHCVRTLGFPPKK